MSYSQDEFRAINADFEQNFLVPASLNDLLTLISFHLLYLTTWTPSYPILTNLLCQYLQTLLCGFEPPSFILIWCFMSGIFFNPKRNTKVKLSGDNKAAALTLCGHPARPHYESRSNLCQTQKYQILKHKGCCTFCRQPLHHFCPFQWRQGAFYTHLAF